MKKRLRHKSIVSKTTSWTVDQDCYLIENNDLPITDLASFLPFSEDEIINRKAILGLIRREKSFKKLLK